MKKFISMFSVLLLLIVLVGCNSNALDKSSNIPTESSFLTESGTDSTSDSFSESSETESKTDDKNLSNREDNSTAKKQTDNSISQTTSKPPENSQSTSKPQESTKPTESTASTVPKSAFAKPFDIATMKSELIAYGKSIGMTHVTHMPEEWGGGLITTEGTTWLPPHETWLYNIDLASKLKQDLCDRIKRWKNEGADVFTLIFEKDSKHSGDYIIYVVVT